MNNPNLQLSYPVMYLFNRPKDIGNVCFNKIILSKNCEIIEKIYKKLEKLN